MRRPGQRILILALDIGSSSTRAALFDEKARILAGTVARREYAIEYAAGGAAELAPQALLRAVRSCLRETLKAHRSSKFRGRPIAAVGGSAFWHSLLGLDGAGRPVTPVFTWADSRCASDAARLRERFQERLIHAETGCVLRSSYWPAKLRWLRRTDRSLFQTVAQWVSPAEWIFAEIFGGAGPSPSMASGTGLYDMRGGSWHAGLLEACAIDRRKLPDISRAATCASRPAGLRGAQVFAPIGDGAASNLGCGADGNGRVAINLGTSAAVRIITRKNAGHTNTPFGLFRYAVDSGRDVVGGAISNAGNLHRWCERELRTGAEGNRLDRRSAAQDGLTVLPFWIAERAPTWPENLSGTIVGLTQATDAAAILRATTCATFYRLAQILSLIEQSNGRAREIIVSGGATRSPELLSVLADALGRDSSVADAESSLRGAAHFVLGQLGYPRPARPKVKIVRHDARLAKAHRRRRSRQEALESLLGGGSKSPGQAAT
jgi:gluconokinase